MKNSTISDTAADPIAQATLPLPEDLRAQARVVDENPPHRLGGGVKEVGPAGERQLAPAEQPLRAEERA